MPALEAGLLTFDGRALGFRHELARLAVLESLPLLRVQELHRPCSTTLSTAFAERPGVLARLVHHAVGAGDGEAVQRFAPAAARQAARLGAHREAAAHYRTALAWADSLETRRARRDHGARSPTSATSPATSRLRATPAPKPSRCGGS